MSQVKINETAPAANLWQSGLHIILKKPGYLFKMTSFWVSCIPLACIFTK